MTYRIQCYTLFDVTNTGVPNRSKPADVTDEETWRYKRNTQANFDTVLQSISLRSQPDVIKKPEKINIRFDKFQNFGFLFEQLEEETYPTWFFEFDVYHNSVFDNGIIEFGFLYSDCDRVPMILCGTEWDKLPAFLDTSPELRNIYFTLQND
jgi:hypothetical protein